MPTFNTKYNEDAENIRPKLVPKSTADQVNSGMTSLADTNGLGSEETVSVDDAMREPLNLGNVCPEVLYSSRGVDLFNENPAFANPNGLANSLDGNCCIREHTVSPVRNTYFALTARRK
jgi:hypothetical protein